MRKKKFLWFTDCHFDTKSIIDLIKFLFSIRKEDPSGVFLTGDISNSLMIIIHLKLLARFIKCPIYFVLGNHDYFFSSFKKIHQKIRELCKVHSNLVWMTDSNVIPLSDEVALIGVEGWYDAQLGNPNYLKYTPDWILIKDFKKLPNMSQRIEAFRELSKQSCALLESKLEQALAQDFKKIYILTHFPPWKEATRDEGTFLEPLYLPYNVNLALGQTIEKVMKDKHKRSIMVLAGHTHNDCWIHVSRNIECKVNKAKYYGHIRNEEHIFI